jgi:monolysocardiolipin acyltransferase
MPEGRRQPWKFFPRPGASLSVTFGKPLPAAAVSAALGVGQRMHVRGLWQGDDGDGKHQSSQGRREVGTEIEARIAVTDLVQRAVEALGRQVSGDLLTGPPHQQPQQRT